MHATSQRETLARRINDRPFYGWIVLAVAALGLPFGATFDLIGDHVGVLLAAAVLPVMCARAILVMRLPHLGASARRDRRR